MTQEGFIFLDGKDDSSEEKIINPRIKELRKIINFVEKDNLKNKSTKKSHKHSIKELII